MSSPRIHSPGMLLGPLQFPQLCMLPGEGAVAADEAMTIDERRKCLKRMSRATDRPIGRGGARC